MRACGAALYVKPLVFSRRTLDFLRPFPYNTTIGNDGIKYPSHARAQRAFGWWKRAAAAMANTSLSPTVKLQ